MAMELSSRKVLRHASDYRRNKTLDPGRIRDTGIVTNLFYIDIDRMISTAIAHFIEPTNLVTIFGSASLFACRLIGY